MSLKNKALQFLLLLFISANVFSQETKEKTADKKEAKDAYNTWAVGLGLSSLKTYGDFTSFGGGNFDRYSNFGTYIYVDKMFNPLLGLEFKIDYSALGAAGQDFTGDYAIRGIDETIYGNQVLTMDGYKLGLELDAIVNLSNLWKLDSKHWSWSFIAGIGTQYYNTKLYDESDNILLTYGEDDLYSSLYVNAGLGVKYKINKRFDVEIRPTINVNNADTFDAAVSTKKIYETFLTTHIGVIYKFGKEKRYAIWANNDDIGDERFQVTDTDEDGVIDEVDKEPETPKEAQVYGSGVAVDTDMDGIPDYRDKCHLIPGIEANEGCPEDKDGDGIFDYDDVCPEIKGVAENLGCPKQNTPDDITKRIFLLAKSIYFKTNSDVIKDDSFSILNEIANIMLQYPNTQYTIDGYTDNTGEADYNLYLSEKRAASVSNYLADRGVDYLRLYSVGHGEENPTHSNDTEQGRKFNRRVEINFIQPDSEQGREVYDPETNVTESVEIVQPQTAGMLQDTDKDGVADVFDQEPDTPVGALVYGNGVAVDTDKDGLPDYMDDCPMQFGPADKQGCPSNLQMTTESGENISMNDSDGDGVIDALDVEPNTPQGAKVYGNGAAIDTDKDGVIDLEDNCPLLPGTEANQGCPAEGTVAANASGAPVDSDGDGVIDALDEEPNTPQGAKVYGNGVAIDTDNDGVIDLVDSCPLQPGTEEMGGCPQNINTGGNITMNDSDGDGVIDSLDKEPNTPLDARVYGNGVAVDTDGDGIPDHADACPLKYGAADKDGCPISQDSDGDGVPNEFDKEPNTPFGVKVYGNGVAMDIDSDGTPDHKDACPLQPGESAYGGCPQTPTASNAAPASNTISLKDSDRDGVVDQFDLEPNTPQGAKVYGNGISIDTDYDGIPDHSDKCPIKPGTLEDDGCPKVTEATAASVQLTDSDNDGVIDQFDIEPNTPAGAKVYGNGVAIDTDYDGIPDHADDCPNASGTAALGGCPEEDKTPIVAAGPVNNIELIDSDNDGVIDQFDRDPNTPEGALVYGNGIPIDSDRDGLPDYKDKCPLEAGPVEQEGCPATQKEFDWNDDDGDGVVNQFDQEPNTPKDARVYGNGVAVDSDYDDIPDHIDECPFKAGPVENKGCPKIEGAIESSNVDTDKDGVIDLYDKEPDTPFGVKVYSNGVSIDSDKDGVPDYKDRCPLIKGMPENEGCPEEGDLDGDGITDSQDLCPDVKGTIENNGCPDKSFDKSVYLKIEALAQKISFERTKNTLTNETMDILDEIIKIMEDYPATKYQIAAHTDNKHNEKYSLFLSKRRANAILKYLVDGGINEDRLTSEGYGDTQPKYSNSGDLSTSELNNRIEFNYQAN